MQQGCVHRSQNLRKYCFINENFGARNHMKIKPCFVHDVSQDSKSDNPRLFCKLRLRNQYSSIPPGGPAITGKKISGNSKRDAMISCGSKMDCEHTVRPPRRRCCSVNGTLAESRVWVGHCRVVIHVTEVLATVGGI